MPPYVRDIFDCFAADFDEKLTELDYQVPQLIATEIGKYPWPHGSRILDLGCGTGLLAHALGKGYELHGVDLSKAMLDKATMHGAYKALHCDDIEVFMSANKIRFQAICGADVFCYFGDLATIMTHAWRCLLYDGVFIFSLETPEKQPAQQQGYHLAPSGRYQHDPQYISVKAQEIGFHVTTQTRHVLRTEYASPVQGHVHVLTKTRQANAS
ncbi:MAG: methyltransferase domain-containing protein [Pseudomonadota bacterium]